MADFIICVVMNLFRVYLIGRFIHIFLDKGEGTKGRSIGHMPAYVGFFLVNTAAYLIFHMVWVNIICNLAGIGLIVLTYTRSVKTILFVTCSVCMINMGCNTITTLLFVDYKDGSGFSQVYEIITIFLIMICELLAERIVDVRRKMGNVRNISLVMIPLCSIGILCAMIFTRSSTEIGLVITSIGLVSVNLFTFYLYNMLSDAFYQRYENEMLRQTIQNYSSQLDIMLQGEEKVKALRHDMKHHMNELKILAAKNENEAIGEYIDNMGEFISNPNEIVSSGNLEIDSVMNYMLIRAKQELRTVNVHVRLPEDVSHSFDVNVILGNLLENGIEAASRTEDKRLDVDIELRQGVMRIRIENSYNGKTEMRHQKMFTTKKGKGLHGIGLENVRKIVEKYDGIMEIRPDGGTFRVMLLLYMSGSGN